MHQAPTLTCTPKMTIARHCDELNTLPDNTTVLGDCSSICRTARMSLAAAIVAADTLDRASGSTIATILACCGGGFGAGRREQSQHVGSTCLPRKKHNSRCPSCSNPLHIQCAEQGMELGAAGNIKCGRQAMVVKCEEEGRSVPASVEMARSEQHAGRRVR